MREGTSIRLSEREIEHAQQVAPDNRAAAEERIRRYANPGEREEVGRRINPETALVLFFSGSVSDPYDDDPYYASGSACLDGMDNWGRNYFAVDPDEGVAVWLGDLPEATREALDEKQNAANAKGWKQLLSLNAEEPDA